MLPVCVVHRDGIAREHVAFVGGIERDWLVISVHVAVAGVSLRHFVAHRNRVKVLLGRVKKIFWKSTAAE